MQQMQVPTLSRVNKIIICIYGGLFLLGTILSQAFGISLIKFLGLSYNGVTSGHIYQLVTFPFVDNGFMAVLFNALLVWFIGSDLENKWGERLYITFLAVSTYASGLFYILLTSLSGYGMMMTSFYGLAGMNLALLMAYGIIYSERTMVFMFIFPMKAKYFCMLIGGVELYMALFSNVSQAAWSHIVAIVAGFMYLRYKSAKSRGWSLKKQKDEMHKKRMKQKLTLVKGSEDKADKSDPKFWQ